MGERAYGSMLWDKGEVLEIRTINDVRAIFPESRADLQNLAFVGIKGFYGNGMTLDELEEVFSGNHPQTNHLENGKWWVNILIVHPRIAVLKYGCILVGPKDVPFLREIVRTTLEVINEHQANNL